MATASRDRLRRAALLGGCGVVLLSAACAASGAGAAGTGEPRAPVRTAATSRPDPGEAAADIELRPPTAVLADDFERASSALFSPDGSLLAVEDAQLRAAGCFGYTLSRIHVYDTTTWRERLITSPGGALASWAFSPGGETLLVATRSSLSSGDGGEARVMAIDTRSGVEEIVSPGVDASALGEARPTARDAANRLEAVADGGEVRLIDVATGKQVRRLGLPRAHVEARAVEEGRAVLFAALWPAGELSAWNAVTGEPVSLSPEPRAPVSAFATNEAGSLALVEESGEVWLYGPGAGALQGRKVAKLPGASAVAMALDAGATRVFIGTARGQIVGLDTGKGRRTSSAFISGDTPESLTLSDDRLLVESRQGRTWEIDLASGRVLSQEPVIGLLSGGDPNAPIEPWGEGEMTVRTAAVCGSQCWVMVGDTTVRLVPGVVPGTAAASDGVSLERLGEGAESSFLCLKGAVVAPYSECAQQPGVRGLVGEVRERELRIRQARRAREERESAAQGGEGDR